MIIDALANRPVYPQEPAHFSNESEDAFLREQMRLYGKEHQTFYSLKDQQEDKKEELIGYAHSKARRLSDITREQAFIDLVSSLFQGGLIILAAGTKIESMQKLLMGIGETCGRLSLVGKQYLDHKKIPLQTELELIKGVEIPGLEKEARDYFEALKELKETLRRLAEMQMNALHSIHQN